MFSESFSKQRQAAFLLFLIGLFSATRINVGGKLGISEFVTVACAPFVFMLNINLFKRDKVLRLMILPLLWLGGALFVDITTSNYYLFMLRGVAVPITVFSNMVCIYVLLRRNLDNLRWLLLGAAISSVVSIFIFQGGVAGDVAAEQGLEAGIEMVVGYKLFWVNQLTVWLTLPITGWYMKTPRWYAIVALVLLAAFALATGGRSAFLVTSFSLVLVTFGGKTRDKMMFVRRHIYTMAILMILFGVGVKVLYKHAAEAGYMGERELDKFEAQTARGSSALRMLMAGRGDFFIGLIAALDKPLVGHGSVATDNGGYCVEFLTKYGNYNDFTRIYEEYAKNADKQIVIPAHSHIIEYWMWHGFFGLLFWVVIIILAIKTLVRRMHIYPGWYGYFSLMIPMFLWDVLFSPFGRRIGYATLFVAFALVAKVEREQRDGVVAVKL